MEQGQIPQASFLSDDVFYFDNMQALEKYQQAIDSLLGRLNIEFKDNLSSVLVVGSWARGDFIPGQSDIDINVVMKTGASSDYESKVKKIASDIQHEYLSGLPYLKEEVMGISVTTLEEILSSTSYLGSGFVYYDFMNSSQVIFGEDIRDKIQIPDKKKIHASARKCIDDILSKYAYLEDILKLDYESASKYFATKENMAELAFAMFFRGTSVFLAAKGIYVSDKKLILDEVNRENYPDWMKQRLSMAYKNWTNWRQINFSNEDTFDFLKMAYIYLKSIRSLI